jgi:hypothetical protein
MYTAEELECLKNIMGRRFVAFVLESASLESNSFDAMLKARMVQAETEDQPISQNDNVTREF